MNKTTQAIFAGITAVTIGFAPAMGGGEQIHQEGYGSSGDDPSSITGEVVTVESNALLPFSSPYPPLEAIQKIRVTITAYSSTVSQTDDTPFITAAGTRVRDGIVAANMLPLGTKIRIPELYGEKVFVVEDRMHPRNYGKVDIWFPSYSEARHFGVKQTQIEILER